MLYRSGLTQKQENIIIETNLDLEELSEFLKLNNINKNNLDIIIKLNQDLNIDITDIYKRGLILYSLADNLVRAGLDYYKRDSYLDPNALLAWQEMVSRALKDNVELYICSAFRDYNYQANLIRNKLAKGLAIGEIIKVLAAPGFSEHHTGRAIDIISPEIPELSQNFENTNAFKWLTCYAKDYSFYLSFPQNNPYGIIYEPWHWCFK